MTVPLDPICPHCGKRNERYPPMPRNVLVCLHCGNISVVTDEAVYIPGPVELEELTAEENVRSAHRFINERLART